VAAAEAGLTARPWAIRLRGGGLLLLGAASLVGCSYNVVLGSVTNHRLPALQCGTWNSLGVHTTDEYFVGHSAARPNDTFSYFVFDLSPVQGKTVTAASLTIPGTSDWKITVPEPPPTTLLAFKLGTTPLPASLTLARVTGGASDLAVYQDVRAEQDLGFAWSPSGSTTNTYDAFHYDNPRLQRAVSAGGMYPIFAVDRFTDMAPTEEYLYGGGSCGPDIVLMVEAE
jgi:hypothetical protein